MDNVQIPASIQVLIDLEQIPVVDNYQVWRRQPGNEFGTETDFLEAMRGLPGRSGSTAFQFQFLPAGSTTASAAYSQTGLEACIQPGSVESRVKIEVSGFMSNDSAGMIAQLSIFRKIGEGAWSNMAPSGASGLAATRSINSDRVEPFSILWVDAPHSTENVTYALYWMTYGGVARLGKRPDQLMMLPTTMMLTEMP